MNIFMQITSTQIRQKFLDFFAEKNHAIIPSAPLVPENDPTALFNVAGMQPIVPYLLGEKHPSGNRLADVQKCIRTNDIDEVGDNSHLTFFEMLGNWSLGDYFKEKSIAWSYELLVDRLGIDPKKLAVTVFKGDADAPKDETSAILWKETGIPDHKISYLGKEDNWWGPAGQTGPCGPDTEIFYWVGDAEFPPENSNVKTDEDNWMEIWNNVFMEYVKQEDGNFVLAKQKNVDTGMGLERITTILNGEISVYNTDVFQGILEKISEVLDLTPNPFPSEERGISEQEASMRIIADHARTAVLLISDGVLPSNVEQGYILRRLMRRAIRQAYKLGYQWQFLAPIAEVVIEELWEVYPNLQTEKATILSAIDTEEKQFLTTLEKGLREFDKLLKGFEIAYERTGKKVATIAGAKAFKLYDTYGFPIEMTVELAEEKGLSVDVAGFEKAYADHQEKSRAGAEKKFAGGLADDSETTTALHSATHLMLAGLRKVLGDHVHQKGSNITAERLRFDFNHDAKLTDEEKQAVEAYVNEAIASGLSVTVSEIAKVEAEADRSIEGSFWEKYPDVVKVYNMVGENGVTYSRELCGGPHVENSKNMGIFKIRKEQASSAGVRRIKAVLMK